MTNVNELLERLDNQQRDPLGDYIKPEEAAAVIREQRDKQALAVNALNEWREDHWSDSQLCDFIDKLKEKV